MLRVLLAAVLLCTGSAGTALALGPFVAFETGHTRPLALSPDESRLFAVNTPDNRLEIFDVDGAGNLTHAGAVAVGMEPVAVAARTNTEVWVVNHLSDSVSVVSLAGATPRVVATLLVGDEPRDIVFAGSGGTRAFITTAHRGQNSGVPASDLTAPGIARADVWVFDATALGPGLGGTPITVVRLFGDTPRALAVTPDGGTVYAAVFHSGNRTTVLNEALVCDGGSAAGACTISGNGAPGGLPAPSPVNCANEAQPETGLIVRFNPAASQWQDTLGRDWSNMVKLQLPDQDVFAIDANANPPVQTGTPWVGVGTILFNMAVNPQTGVVYVSNTDARNEVRFEGPGSCSTTVQGHLHEARVTLLSGPAVTPRHLNTHIDYAVRPAPPNVKPKSLATPTDLLVTPDGSTLYVAAFGSSKVGVFDTAQLAAAPVTPDPANQIVVSGGGPSGLALRGNRLYVSTRFDNGISIVDRTAKAEVGHLTLPNPEPSSVVEGRPVLYDATSTSSNGEASCSSCHIFGDFDSLAWDLGNPDDTTATSPLPQRISIGDPDFFPMKGPMTTQSLRGMANHGALHWRGDRSNGFFGVGAFDEALSFMNFIVAFPGLVGNDGHIPTADMQKFTDFALQINYPPNPIRNLDNSLTANQQAGQNFFFGPISDTVFNCNGCHTLDASQGFFGTDGFATFEGEAQHFKVSHLRNLYQKVGMFGMAANGFITGGGSNANLGPQVRGFGFLHDGSVDTVFRFLSANVFQITNTQKTQVEQFALAFPSTLAPVVGQQVTLTSANAATVAGRINLLILRASASFVLAGHPGARECELIVKGTIGGLPRGWRFDPVTGLFKPDRAAEPPIGDLALRALAGTAGQELTYTCAPPGSGTRMGIDRDLDGVLDGDEALPPGAGGCSPIPQNGCATPGRSVLSIKDNADDARDRFGWRWLKGTAAIGDFGTPMVDDAYAVCLYGPSGVLLFGAAAPAGSNWRTAGADGLRYHDSLRVPDGLVAARLRAGLGRAKATANGRGANLPAVPLPLALPARVQLQGNGRCWEDVYTTVGLKKNDAARFRGEGGSPSGAFVDAEIDR